MKINLQKSINMNTSNINTNTNNIQSNTTDINALRQDSAHSDKKHKEVIARIPSTIIKPFPQIVITIFEKIGAKDLLSFGSVPSGPLTLPNHSNCYGLILFFIDSFC